jgi:putative transposase
MSLPREVLPGSTYMITRRCTQRQFLMRPDDETNNAFIYCLAEAAARHQVDVIFTIAMSNHHHTGIHDRHGNYPAFIERFHRLFAKCQNSLRGRSENFWSTEQTSVVRLAEPNDVLAKMTYALSNPVKDNLVEAAREWPGVNALLAIAHNKALRARRPRHFFSEEGVMPEQVSLTFTRPPGFEHLSAEEFGRLVVENVARVEEASAYRRRSTGERALGRRAVLRQDWRDHPATPEPARDHHRSFFRSKWSKMEALLRNRAFRDAYIAARRSFLDGVRDTVFPAGTYWLRRFAQVPCAAFPPPA